MYTIWHNTKPQSRRTIPACFGSTLDHQLSALNG